MKIKRYMGENTQEAILKVKMDLGNEAIILNTKKVKPRGFLKIFSKPMFEVLAAVDDDYGTSKDKSGIKQYARVATPERDRLAPKPFEKDEKMSELEDKVNSMEMMLKKIYEKVQPGGTEQGKQRTSLKVMQLFYNNLIKNDVEEETAKNIIDSVTEKVGEQASLNDVASVLYSEISNILGKPEPLCIKEDGKPTIVMIIGPTGVGKTTTLAKIAANYALNHDKKVGLITADTYRIAAVEQLKTYADILGMPINVIYSPKEINEAIELYSDKDIILIDTAGRNHYNKEQFEELKALVKVVKADETYLLLNTTVSINNCREILKSYSFINDYKLIFTKLDETNVMGVILNARYMTNKCLSYITTGQSVPDDIEIADVEKITKNLLGSIS